MTAEGLQVQAIMRFLHEKNTADYISIATVTLMMYDYILTLHIEIGLIWCSSWGYIKALCFLTRYVPMVSMWLFIYLQSSPTTSLHASAAWLLIIGVTSAEMVLATRTWAVWGRDRRVGLGLLILMAGALVPQLIFVSREISSVIIEPGPYPELTGLVIVSNSKFFWPCFAALAVVDGVMLVLMVISAFRAYRSGNHSKLMDVIYTDGILVYTCLLGLTIANVTLISVFELEVLIVPQSVFYSILTTRAVLNIRMVISGTQGGVTNPIRPMEFCVHDGSPEIELWTQPPRSIEQDIEDS